MSLKAKFKTDTKMVNDGVWFDVVTNSDGSVCRVRLRRPGRGNKAWAVAFARMNAEKDAEEMTQEEDDAASAALFAEGCVVEWENLQLDDDGVNLEFNAENAVNLMSDPDWITLQNDWQTKANTIGNFQAKEAKRKANAKN